MVNFQQIQAEFTQAIRQNQTNPFNNIDDQRFAVYSRLIRNNIKSFLQQGFPVIHNLLEKNTYEKLMDGFIAQHYAQSPYFSDISAEFITYLNNGLPVTENTGLYPPFLQELAHYEWLETLLIHHEEDEPDSVDITDFISSKQPLIWSKNAVAAAYQFPVHKISRQFQPSTPPEQPTFLIIYRQNNSNHFLAVDALAFKLFTTGQNSEKPLTTTEIINLAIQPLAKAEKKLVYKKAEKTLFHFYQLNLILGTA